MSEEILIESETGIVIGVESSKDLPVYGSGIKTGLFTEIKRKPSSLYLFVSTSRKYRETMSETRYKAVLAAAKKNPVAKGKGKGKAKVDPVVPDAPVVPVVPDASAAPVVPVVPDAPEKPETVADPKTSEAPQPGSPPTVSKNTKTERRTQKQTEVKK